MKLNVISINGLVNETITHFKQLALDDSWLHWRMLIKVLLITDTFVSPCPLCFHRVKHRDMQIYIDTHTEVGMYS